jgi:hypothetical protein
MNEKIKDLMTEAGISVEYVTNTKQIVILEKFAELIVQECSKISEDDITDGDACCTNTAYRIARQIKQRFGVE